MADPVTLAAVGSLLAGVGAVAGAVMSRGGPEAPKMPDPVKPKVPDAEVAKRTSTDRQRERLRSVASGSNTKLTGGQGIQTETEEEASSGRSRKTILGR